MENNHELVNFLVLFFTEAFQKPCVHKMQYKKFHNYISYHITYVNISWIQYGISYMYTLFSGVPTVDQI